MFNANLIYRLNLNVFLVKEEDGKTYANKIHSDMIVASFYSEVVQKLLNNLEFFAMHFEHETADETAVYQSLHQTYIIIVRKLYYNISTYNKELDTHYFTNTIGLYKRWNKRKKDKEEEIVTRARESSEKGNSVGKIDD